MSTPLAQQPPPVMMTHKHNTESVGTTISVLLVIIILGVLAGMVGRLCSGKRIMGYGEYDLERWAESKCSSCIDGSISRPLPMPMPNVSDTNSSRIQASNSPANPHS